MAVSFILSVRLLQDYWNQLNYLYHQVHPQELFLPMEEPLNNVLILSQVILLY